MSIARVNGYVRIFEKPGCFFKKRGFWGFTQSPSANFHFPLVPKNFMAALILLSERLVSPPFPCYIVSIARDNGQTRITENPDFFVYNNRIFGLE